MMGIGGGSYHNVLWCIIVGSNWPSFKLVFIVWGFLGRNDVGYCETQILVELATHWSLDNILIAALDPICPRIGSGQRLLNIIISRLLFGADLACQVQL